MVKHGAQIVFTGFRPSARHELEKRAEEHGMSVVTRVTKDLAYLCKGDKPALSKMERAETQGVTILDVDELTTLWKSGELPAASCRS